jgi:AbrB family looped-hinge helix DNA binding protein
MKDSTITTTNSKGQIVIPKAIRKALKISENVALYVSQRGGGIYIHPIQDVVLVEEAENKSYVKVLKEARGSWGEADAKEKKREEEKRELELKASEQRKKQW